MKRNLGKVVELTRRMVESLASWCLLSLLLAVGSAGCKEGVTGRSETKPEGNYALVSVDGNPVPGVVHHGGAALTVKSGELTINADGTCSSKMVFAPPSGVEATREVRATYVCQGATLTMRWQGAGTTTGTIKDGTFTMNNEGMIFAYRKQ